VKNIAWGYAIAFGLIAFGGVAGGVTTMLISQIRSTNTTVGSIAVTPPGSAIPVWATPGSGLSISSTGVVSSSGAVGPQGPAGPTGPTGAAGAQGPAGPGGTPFAEVPAGTINGTNAVFTLSFTPLANSQVLFRNGQALFIAAGDYTLSGTTITFQSGQIPQSGDQIIAQYEH
jgi:hypothetical protein